MIDLGLVPGNTTLDLSYSLTAKAAGDGFGFVYAMSDPIAGVSLAGPLAAPEPPVWALMATGFAALALAGFRARATVATR